MQLASEVTAHILFDKIGGKEAMAYVGPKNIKKDVALALQTLERTLSAKVKEFDTHSLVEVSGLTDDPRIVSAVGVYLVGAITSVIAYNMKIRQALFKETDIERDVYRDVVGVIGENNKISDDEKTMNRDPWLWEGISHLLFHVSRNVKDMHPPGVVMAKTFVHPSVKIPGLDLVAIYETSGVPGVSIAECKAYLTDGATAITDAANRLSEVDRGARDLELRETVGQLRDSLPDSLDDLITESFWKDERAYFPMVFCDQALGSTDWKAARKSLRRLERPLNRKFLIPIALPDARKFCDKVCTAMRAYAKSNLTKLTA